MLVALSRTARLNALPTGLLHSVRLPFILASRRWNTVATTKNDATATTTSSDVAPSGVNTPRASTSLPRIPSAAPPGTPLTGINILKAGTDPIALADDAYPAWLWTLTENGSATDTSGATSSDEDDEAKKSIRLRIRKARERFIKEQNVASRKRR